MNLVLSEPQGERLILMDHGDWGHLMGDAETLARLLDKPVFNATISSRVRPQ